MSSSQIAAKASLEKILGISTKSISKIYTANTDTGNAIWLLHAGKEPPMAMLLGN